MQFFYRSSPMEVFTRGFSDSEMVIEDCCLVSQCHIEDPEELSILPIAAAIGETWQNSMSYHPISKLETYAEASQPGIHRPENQIEANGWSSWEYENIQKLLASLDPTSIHVQNPNQINQMATDAFPSDDMLISPTSFENQNHIPMACQAPTTNRINTSPRLSRPRDHILAERKRREKLSQKFIALSAIVPGLKKMDKASVLGDAVKYMKQLQERVKTLEEQTKQKKMESAVFVRKSQLLSEEDNIGGPVAVEEPLPEIEARFCEKSVLTRVHCERRRGIVERTVEEIEKCHLKVINSSVLTFGSSALDITIIASMDVKFCMTVSDLVNILRSALELFMSQNHE